MPRHSVTIGQRLIFDIKFMIHSSKFILQVSLVPSFSRRLFNQDWHLRGRGVLYYPSLENFFSGLFRHCRNYAPVLIEETFYTKMNKAIFDCLKPHPLTVGFAAPNSFAFGQTRKHCCLFFAVIHKQAYIFKNSFH